MGLESRRDAEDGDERPGRRRHDRSESHDWKTYAEARHDSLPHPWNGQVHRPGRRTSRRAESRSRSLDATEPTMPPPPPQLGRSSTDVYRRPRHWMAHDDGRDSISGRRRSRRDASPRDHRRDPTAERSVYSSTSGLAYSEDDSDHIEVVEEVDDDSTRHGRERQSSRDDYMASSADRRYHRRWRRQRYHDGEIEVVWRRHSFSDDGSPGQESSRTADRSASSRQDRRQQMPDVIEDSRPPVSSKRSLVRRRHRSAEVIQHDDRPRRASTVRSNRSRAGSVSGRPSGILGNIFGAPSRRGSPEKHGKEPKAARRSVKCVICMSDISPSKTAKLKCGHTMCRSCLERNFKLSVTDPQHMPPRCCTQDHIPLKHVDRLFDDRFKKAWNRKFAEFSTRNRLYCPSRKCGEWIKPANIHRENGRKVARCSRCRTKVCGVCNGKWHGSEDCPKDEETARLLAQAKNEGWKRCYRCKAVVELKEGWNHMTCRCGAEFCMICGVKWKGCDCPWFNNDGGFQGDPLEHMNVPVPQIRGDLRDIFDGEGPPAPAELRGQGQHPATMAVPVRPRPRSYREEMLLRQLQEQRDADVARHLQYSDDYYEEHDVMGGVGDVQGVGNAAGHYMNDDYRRGGRFRAAMPPPRATMVDRGADYVADVGRARGGRGDSMERRLADRLSESRSGIGMRPGMASMAPAMRSPPRSPPMGAAPQGRALRQHSIEEELYNTAARAPRSERVAGGRISRAYEDEVELHSPRSRRRAREERPKSSDMAGLNGRGGQGMDRVSQWRSFVEPGVPEGESTVGHA
ncbi:E3 ubiquitin-protein ligase itt1 [Tolypocladium ophioglossoides CBS 100239]|uniref:RBR-type E3 ubiquitin transferase n=1 Tax=Tolypocladium ophioglossoides (strain CBS 100239) TaxID=1163406 RepID=A0A0L0N3Q0_TOLOC|nr:E3 ubiquitin-protein ligase itt1 [Tolypocladium ophioglossoides CBS 100239]